MHLFVVCISLCKTCPNGHRQSGADQDPACLPSLSPILVMITEKIAALQIYRSQHKRGLALLLDMLPRRPLNGLNVLIPVSRDRSINCGAGDHIYDGTVRELGVIALSLPEMEAFAISMPEMRASEPAVTELRGSEPVITEMSVGGV